MPRTKGSKNRVTASTDFDAQIAKLQKDKAMLEEGLSKTVAHIEELKTDIKSLRESLKPQKAEIKQTEKEIAKLEAKKAAVEAKAAEAAKKVEAEAMLKKLLASGMTADEILEKLVDNVYGKRWNVTNEPFFFEKSTLLNAIKYLDAYAEEHT